jgi:predicted O-linked N-acetylglucosamine transferase (SPINDLY family)
MRFGCSNMARVGLWHECTLGWQLMAGRCTKGFYDIMGIDCCIAKDRREYVDMAVSLGSNATRRAEIGAQIEERSSRLWDRMATIPEWEQFFEEALDHKSITNLHSRTRSRPKRQ